MKINARHRRAAKFVAFGAAFLAASGAAKAQPDAKPTAKKGAVPAPATVVAPRLETLEVRAAKAEYGGGEPIYLDIVLINQSAQPAQFLLLGPKLEFVVKRENKKAVLTYVGKDSSKGDKVSYRSVPVGGRFAYRVLLSRQFDLSRAGNYTVFCTKRLKNDNRDPGAELVGPQVIAQVVKFSVAETDFEATPAALPPLTPPQPLPKPVLQQPVQP